MIDIARQNIFVLFLNVGYKIFLHFVEGFTPYRLFTALQGKCVF